MAKKHIYHQRKQQGLCVECGTRAKDKLKLVCEGCGVLKNNRAKKHYQKLRVLEICVWCKRHKTTHNKALCYECSNSLNQYGKWIREKRQIQNDKYFWLHAKKNKETLLYPQRLKDAKNNVLDTLMQCNYHITQPNLCKKVIELLNEYGTDTVRCTIIKNHLLHLYKQDQKYAKI